MAKKKKATLKPSAVVFDDDVQAKLEQDDTPDWVGDSLAQAVSDRLTAKRMEDEVKLLKSDSNDRIQAALSVLGVSKAKTNVGTVNVQQGAPIFSRTVAQEELIRLGVSADVVAKAWKKATKPGRPVVQFRAATIV